MRPLIATLTLALTLPLWPIDATAETPEEKGLAIARESDRRDHGFIDTKTVVTMILENRKGQTSERRLRMHTLEVPDENDGDKSLVIFDHPRDTRGTALLSYAHILDSDDQWIYLQALKRIKRISTRNKSGPFVGSEFAYEDITAQELKKYSYKWLRDERCGALDCFVIERRPLPRLPSGEVKDQLEGIGVTFKYRPLPMNFCKLKSVQYIAQFKAPQLSSPTLYDRTTFASGNENTQENEILSQGRNLRRTKNSPSQSGRTGIWGS